MDPTDKQQPALDSELPTDPAPAQAPVSARVVAAALTEHEPWCDSEAPTGVAVERPILPRPPRAPQV